MAIASTLTGLHFRNAGGRANSSDQSLYYNGTEVVRYNASQFGLLQNLVPNASDGAALGTTSLMWSDLFLASGAVVNFNNGDVTLTHASNSLTVEGGNLLVTENQGWFGTAASTTNAINATKDFGEAAGSNFNGMVLKAVGSETTGATSIITSGIQSLAAIGGSGNDVTNNQNWTATVGLRGVTAAVRTESGSSGTITGGAAFYAANATENGATYTNQYGLYIEDLTVGGSDYGVYIVGADTAAVYVASADPVHLGVAGASTGKLEIDGATSGTVTTTVAAAAGTWTLTLPPDNGDAGEQLQTNGSGVSTWEAAGSLPMFKERHGVLAPDKALRAMLSVDTELFNYREVALDGSRTTTTGDFDTEYAGVMADAAPWAMHHNGRIFNPVNAFGYTRASIEALNEKVERLEAALAKKGK